MNWCANMIFPVLVGNLKKNVFWSLKSLFLTSWLVLIFAFKRHHVLKTFLDHVHIHWVLKTDFQSCFSAWNFQIFKILKFTLFDQSKMFLIDKKCSSFKAKTLCLIRLMFDQCLTDWKFSENFSIDAWFL